MKIDTILGAIMNSNLQQLCSDDYDNDDANGGVCAFDVLMKKKKH